MKNLLPIIILLCLLGCSPRPDQNNVLVEIDNYSLTEQEFLKEVGSISEFHKIGKSKEDLLEDVINKKILLMEAQLLGLDKQESFMRMVERFWEQSLLRLLVETKMKEFSKEVQLTQTEIEQALADMGGSIEYAREMLIRKKTSEEFKKWLASLREQADVSINQELLDSVRLPREE